MGEQMSVLKAATSRISSLFSHDAYRAKPTRMGGSADDDTGWRRAADSDQLANGKIAGGMIGETDDIANRANIVHKIRLIMRKNPFLYRDFVLPSVACLIGSGINVKAKEEKVQDILDEYFKKDAMTPKYQAELAALYLTEGELILPVRTTKYGANLRTTYLYTDTVEVMFSPNDNRLVDWIVRPVDGSESVKFVAIQMLTDKEELFRGYLSGETKDPPGGKEIGAEEGKYTDPPQMAIYVKNSNPSTRRGFPIVYTIADFADILDEFLYQRLNLLRALMRMWLDVTVEGDKTLCEKISEDFKTIPPNGSVDVHNAKVTVEPKRFDLDGAEISEDFRSMLTGFDLATTIPSKYLLGEAEIEAGSMLHKLLVLEQNTFRELFTIILDCQIEAKKAIGLIGKGVDTSYELIFPEVSTKDISKLSTAVNQLALALMTGTQEGWIEHESAAKAFVEAFNMVLDTELKAETTPPEDLDVNTLRGRNQRILPGGGGKQSGQADARSRFIERGEDINNKSKTEVKRA